MTSHTHLIEILFFEEQNITVQDDLLARVIFGKFVCKKQLADFILAIRAIPCLSSRVSSWLYGRVHIVINYWQI